MAVGIIQTILHMLVFFHQQIQEVLLVITGLVFKIGWLTRVIERVTATTRSTALSAWVIRATGLIRQVSRAATCPAGRTSTYSIRWAAAHSIGRAAAHSIGRAAAYSIGWSAI